MPGYGSLMSIAGF